MRISIDEKTGEEKILNDDIDEERIDEDEEVVKEEEEKEERVNEDEEVVGEEDIEERVEEERVEDGVLDEIRTIQNALLKDKKIQLLLVLSRFGKTGITLRRIAEEISADHNYAKRYVQELKKQGLVQQYKVYPDKRTYFRLTNKGEKIAKFIQNCLNEVAKNENKLY